MNTIFDFKRAGLLIQRYFIERFQGELMFWIVSIICIMFIRNFPVALWIFAITACIFRTGYFFREIHSSTNRINYFMIPATQFEKFVVSLFYTIVYFWVMMFVIYVIGNIVGTWVNNLIANIGLVAHLLGFNHHDLSWVIFDYPENVTINFWNNAYTTLETTVVILILQSIFLLGSIYFKKNQVFKTILSLVVIGFILLLITAIEAKYFLIDDIKSYTSGVFIGNGLDFNINGTDFETVKIISIIFFYLLTPYLWLVSYIRLTEKEV